ncbi:hypothetical protein PIB30_059757 [Stylosanthes scabra]|uniref:Uncharacterized protein n=1 Tax=Stylosanthes scabra TaxID=79078 RepID=A0ABU6YKW4_9FABA|nr:hypothetical protein [Stylosanthes scabra]
MRSKREEEKTMGAAVEVAVCKRGDEKMKWCGERRRRRRVPYRRRVDDEGYRTCASPPSSPSEPPTRVPSLFRLSFRVTIDEFSRLSKQLHRSFANLRREERLEFWRVSASYSDYFYWWWGIAKMGHGVWKGDRRVALGESGWCTTDDSNH